MKNRIVFTIILLALGAIAFAQVDTSSFQFKIGFRDYIDLVGKNNLGYAAEKYNIAISEAAIEQAGVFNNPSISFDLALNKEGGTTTGYDIASEVGTTIGLVGKRRARIDLARSESKLIKALVLDYFRNLQAEAALARLEAIKQGHMLRVKMDSYKTMKQLSAADSIRFKLGIIKEIDATQSRVEAGFLLNELSEAEAEWQNSLIRLTYLAGNGQSDSVYSPRGTLQIENRIFNLNDLLIAAQNNRADLIAALNNKEVSQNILRLARKERKADLDVRAGIENSYLNPGGNKAASIMAGGFSIPLNFSNINKGEIKIANYQIAQADEIYKQAELQVRTEVIIALQQYASFCKQADSFENGLLEGAGSVLKGKIYSYERGETSLLEVLSSQRTYNEIQSAYYETLYNRAAALVELEKAAGIWDLQFSK